MCLHAPSLRAVVAAIARLLARATRVDRHYLFEDTKCETARERESKRVIARGNERAKEGVKQNENE